MTRTEYELFSRVRKAQLNYQKYKSSLHYAEARKAERELDEYLAKQAVHYNDTPRVSQKSIFE